MNNNNCCNANTLFIKKCSQKNCSNNSVLGGLGPVDPLDKNKLRPRIKRDKVKEQIRDYVLLMLGAPVIRIELDEQQLDLAVEQTLKIIENYAPREYYEYYVFNTSPGKSVYELPPEVGYVRNVFYKKHPQFAFQSSDLNGAIPVEYFYPGGAYSSIQGGLIDPIQPIWGRMGEWVLYKQYEMMYSRVSSNIGGWEWIGGFKNIKIYPIPTRPQAVIVHYMQKMKDWDEVTQAMQEGALAHAKIMLGRIRSKFVSPPGPGGGMQLDGQQLLQEGIEEYKQWKEDLIYKFGETIGPTLD
jgi:hypothetical protein